MQTEIVSRQEAYVKGLKRFYTGESCKRGHICERFTCNGGCVRCMQFITPNRKAGAKGRNVCWPTSGFIFNTLDASTEEMEAAFRYVEAQGWHDYAIAEMRKDPVEYEKYVTRMKPSEVGKLEAQLARAQRLHPTSVQDALFTLACGFGQLYYGERKAVGDLVECNHCKTLQVITKIE